MATLSLSNPNPNAGTISTPGSVALNYTISGNDPADVKISYNLNSGNNVYFDDGGNLVKEIVRKIHLTNPPLAVSETVRIVKSGPNPDFSLCYINIDGLDLNNNDSDHQVFTLHF
ncbi:hypothetical protein HQ865_24710 [Mucilaginibacter mali]|uniref:Uncharacterized protein n=1 Tax=Mucilaginibacter mali TaxID=2740462 RepID=A0A7D4UQF6_9SPHI|nr:hypothetical protein [Mucilaginibacter mali]QKJ32820.1 hypothetical protein HQ865_24710 [Mucilaginibacter mali]